MDYAKESLRLHGEWKGKIEMVTRVPVKTKDDLSLAYTPGVAQPCLEIQEDINKSYELTRRWNMVAVQVMGNDAAVGIAASQGNFELNVFMPVCAYNFLQSVRLLSEAIASFDKNCASGIRANRERMDENVRRSLMLVTALNPHIGYENAARIAKKAYAENLTLREACAALELLPPEEFDRIVRPERMV